jgi:hypothetical protein
MATSKPAIQTFRASDVKQLNLLADQVRERLRLVEAQLMQVGLQAGQNTFLLQQRTNASAAGLQAAIDQLQADIDAIEAAIAALQAQAEYRSLLDASGRVILTTDGQEILVEV